MLPLATAAWYSLTTSVGVIAKTGVTPQQKDEPERFAYQCSVNDIGSLVQY